MRSDERSQAGRRNEATIVRRSWYPASMAASNKAWLLLLGVVGSAACRREAAAQTGYTAGDTMVPTLAVGEHLAVNAREREPARGRVVVFHAPERLDRTYIKRIVGLPGDVISTSGTEIRVNGTPILRCHLGSFRSVDTDGKSREGELWLEALDGASWLVFHSAAKESIPSGPWTVAPGEVFALGDSRENSHDSRFWYDGKGGGLPRNDIVGAVVGVGGPVLPKGAEALAPALTGCQATLSK
jgi:signal peptidase I